MKERRETWIHRFWLGLSGRRETRFDSFMGDSGRDRVSLVGIVTLLALIPASVIFAIAWTVVDALR